jgi:D-alanine-D-alanine ligase
MALVPAICETFDLTYVGPDVYGRIICQDKEVSKAIAVQAGLKTPPHRIVRSEDDLTSVQDFPLPYVVKPLWEGSSIGIGEDSLVHLRKAGEALLKELLRSLKQPLMVEAFIPGREVSWCFIEGPKEIQLRSFAEVLWNNDPEYFDRNLYDAQHKFLAEHNKVVRNIESELSAEDNDALERLIQLTSPLGYGRVDGKFWNGEFVFLEITPDAWLGPTGTFASGFLHTGFSFPEVIRRLLLSAETSHLHQ